MSFGMRILGVSIYLAIGLGFEIMLNRDYPNKIMLGYILLWPLLIFIWLFSFVVALVVVIFGMFAIIAKSIWYYIPIAVKLLFDTFGVFRTGGKRDERTQREL